MSVYLSKEKRASITVSATFGHQKTRSESSNAIYLWDLRALSSKSIAWGGRRYDQGRFERLQNMLLPSGKVNFAGHYSGRENYTYSEDTPLRAPMPPTGCGVPAAAVGAAGLSLPLPSCWNNSGPEFLTSVFRWLGGSPSGVMGVVLHRLGEAVEQTPWGRPHAALVQWSWGPPPLAQLLCATTGDYPAAGACVLLRSWYHSPYVYCSRSSHLHSPAVLLFLSAQRPGERGSRWPAG